jgi:hypothetical protein
MRRPDTPNRSVATEDTNVAGLAQLLDTILDPVQVLQQMYPLAGQIPQLPNGTWRHPTALQLAALQQIRNPLRILGIGLVAVQSLDVLRIDQQQFLKLAFQQVPQRPPVLAGGFHSDLSHPTVL